MSSVIQGAPALRSRAASSWVNAGLSSLSMRAPVCHLRPENAQVGVRFPVKAARMCFTSLRVNQGQMLCSKCFIYVIYGQKHFVTGLHLGLPFEKDPLWASWRTCPNRVSVQAGPSALRLAQCYYEDQSVFPFRQSFFAYLVLWLTATRKAPAILDRGF